HPPAWSANGWNTPIRRASAARRTSVSAAKASSERLAGPAGGPITCSPTSGARLSQLSGAGEMPASQGDSLAQGPSILRKPKYRQPVDREASYPCSHVALPARRAIRNDEYVIDHISIQCADTAASAAFYDVVLATLGGGRVLDFGDVIGFSIPPTPEFWIGP